MLKYLIILPSLIFAGLWGYVRYGIDPPPIAKYDPIFVDGRFTELEWSADSEILYIRSASIDSRVYKNYAYSVPQLSQQPIADIPQNSSPFFDERLLALFAVSNLSISPNGDYTVYTKQHCSTISTNNEADSYKSCLRELYLYEHATQTITQLEQGDFYRDVRWNADGNAFFVWEEGAYTVLLYYGNLNLAQGGEIWHSVVTSEYNRNYLVDESPSGEWILFTPYRREEFGLYVWQAQHEDEPLLDLEQLPLILEHTPISGAQFLPNNNAEILAITQDGLIKHNIFTQESEILHPELNTRWIQTAYFAPGGQAVAVYAKVPYLGAFNCELYILPLDGRFIVPTGLKHECPFYD